MNKAETFPPLPQLMESEDAILFLGSCFSENIGLKFQSLGCDVLVHPNGTVFHPDPLARFLASTLTPNWTEARYVQRDDLFFSWDMSGGCFGFSLDEIREKSEERRLACRKQLQKAKWVFITLGSAHGYRAIETQQLVANCHKMPAAIFEKELSDEHMLFASLKPVLEALVHFNSDIRIILTVSPVRYLRDGWIENNRSKARLIRLVEQLSVLPQVHYLPVYEWVNDELRDKSFFEVDEVHPNAKAIEVVWKRIVSEMCSPIFQSCIAQIEKYQALCQHRIAFPGSNEAKKFEALKQEKRSELTLRYPHLKL